MNWRELHGDNGDVPEWPDGAENAPEFERKRDMLAGGRGHKIWIVYKALQRLSASDDPNTDALVEKLYQAVTTKSTEDIRRLDIIEAVRHTSAAGFDLDIGQHFGELSGIAKPDDRSDTEIHAQVVALVADPQLATLVATVAAATVAATVRSCSRKPGRPAKGQQRGPSKIDAFGELFAAIGMAISAETVRDALAIPPADWDDD